MPIQLLDTRQAEAKLARMAYEILENNYEAQAINLLGVSVRGQYLAKYLSRFLQAHTDKHVAQDTVTVSGPQVIAGLALSAENPIILVDDVLYTGRTLFAAVQQVAALPATRIQVAMLIDRGHHNLPLAPDYVGLNLATTLQAYIRVELDEAEQRIEAFLD